MKQMRGDGASLITPREIASHSIGAEKPPVDDLAHGSLELSLILSAAELQFVAGAEPAAAVMARTIRRLRELRAKFSPATWHQLTEMARDHPVTSYFLQDPFVRHSFEKPRGYSGDAELLDYIYEHPSIEDQVKDASPLGKDLYAFGVRAPAPEAVRERRDLLAAEVDRVARAKPGEAEVLTIAAGHLREAYLSSAARSGALKRWIALDQDPLSIGAIIRDLGETQVDAVDGSVKGILTNAYQLGQFDLVYAAGLYDYLPRAVAIKLTRKCMAMLKPGGSFLFANFSDEVEDIGFMETFMNWMLLLRSEGDMWDIVNASADRNAVDAEVFFGANRNIIYARLTKRD